jgi:hypothetical protein
MPNPAPITTLLFDGVLSPAGLGQGIGLSVRSAPLAPPLFWRGRAPESEFAHVRRCSFLPDFQRFGNLSKPEQLRTNPDKQGTNKNGAQRFKSYRTRHFDNQRFTTYYFHLVFGLLSHFLNRSSGCLVAFNSVVSPIQFRMPTSRRGPPTPGNRAYSHMFVLSCDEQLRTTTHIVACVTVPGSSGPVMESAL